MELDPDMAAILHPHDTRKIARYLFLWQHKPLRHHYYPKKLLTGLLAIWFKFWPPLIIINRNCDALIVVFCPHLFLVNHSAMVLSLISEKCRCNSNLLYRKKLVWLKQTLVWFVSAYLKKVWMLPSKPWCIPNKRRIKLKRFMWIEVTWIADIWTNLKQDR